jgi:hypothetical protein
MGQFKFYNIIFLEKRWWDKFVMIEFYVVKLGRDKLKNRWIKNVKIYLKLGSKNDAKKCIYKCQNRRVENWWKFDEKWPVIKCSKSVLKIDFYGGGRRGSKSSKIDLGGPGPQKRNFLKFCSFLQKLPTFRPPFSTPKKGPIENVIPHK